MPARASRGGGGSSRRQSEPQAAPEPQPIEGELVPVSAIRQEYSDMVAIAMRYPRDLHAQLDDAIKELELAPELAERNWYELEFKKHGTSPTGNCTKRSDDDCEVGSKAEGLSVVVAYLIKRHYKHLATKCYVLGEDEDQFLLQGVCRDLQNNTYTERPLRVSKKRFYKGGRSSTLYGPELDRAFAAGASKCIRESILKAVPEFWKKRIHDKCRQLDASLQADKAGGKEKHKENLRQQYAKINVTEEILLKKLRRKKIGDVTDEDRSRLQGWYNAITSGEATVEDIFGAVVSEPSKPAETGATTTSSEEPGQEPAEEAEAEPEEKPDPAPKPKRRVQF